MGNIIYKYQFELMKSIGTNAIILIRNVIYEKWNKRTPIAVRFLDLAKAFVTVNNKILLDN